MDWRRKRQLLIALFVLGPVALVVALWLIFFTPERQPTCSDGLQNGEERGVDCGPTCGRVCPFEIKDPIAAWTRTLERGSNTYDVVSLVSLPGTDVTASDVPYVIRFYDSDGVLLLEESGTADFPPRDEIVIIREGLSSGAREVSRSVLVFPEEVDWQYDLTTVSPELRVTSASLAPVAAGTRLDVEMSSTGDRTFTNVDLLVLLFDDLGNLFDYTTTFLPLVRPGETHDAVLTWPEEPGTVERVQVFPISFDRAI